jgi:hypothetical protein
MKASGRPCPNMSGKGKSGSSGSSSTGS